MSNITTKTITITLPLHIADILQSLPTTELPQLEKYKGRKISNICTLILTEKLQSLNLESV